MTRIPFGNLFLITLVWLTTQCTREQRHQTFIVDNPHYPQPLPDSAALRFLPGIVSSDSLDFNAAFSRDGKRFYFCRSYQGKWMIYVTEFLNDAWSKPLLAPFTEAAYSQADPFITPDETIYYISNR